MRISALSRAARHFACASCVLLVAVLLQFWTTPARPAAAWPIEQHRGVDSCANESTSRMATLYQASPYGTYGFYIGGLTVNRSCPSHASFHNQAWANTVKAQGWNLQPIYSGRQPGCHPNTTVTYPISTNPTTAYSQGQSEGNDAIFQAYTRGIAGPIWLDMDIDIPDSYSCRPSVDNYIRGWMGAVRANAAYIPSLYTGYANANRAATFAVANRPYQVTIPHWNNIPGVYGGLPNLNRSYWTGHQRGHQYRGGHNESWGGLTFNVDNNCYDEYVHGSTNHSVYAPCVQ